MSQQKRSEVTNLDPENNPKLKEIYDILLLAGYFRIRIPSIGPLDKIQGGLSWCITQSNFDIDLEYSDDFNIGQKIRLSEKIVAALEQMNCPTKLQPHQIQGLDLNQLYLVVQWLIRFVLDTREFRQDQNKRVTKFVGTNTLEALQVQNLEERNGIREVFDQLELIRDKRQTKNLKTSKLTIKDPLRVYSALIEYGDLSSQRTYNKLCALVSGKLNLGEKQQGRNSLQRQSTKEVQSQPMTIQQLLLQDNSETDPKKGKQQNISFTNLQKVTVENIQNIDKEKLQQAQKQIQEMSLGQGPSLDSTLDEEESRQFSRLERRNSIQGQAISKLIVQQKEKIVESMQQKQEEDGEDDVLSAANMLKQEKELHQQQMFFYQQNLVNFEKKIQELTNELQQFQQQDSQITQDLQKENNSRQQIDQTLKIIENKMVQIKKQKQEAEIKRAEELVQRRQELKNEKSQMRKQIKEEMKELEKEREQAIKDQPQEDDIQVLQELKQEFNEKRDKYDKKFTQFSQLNQEIAVLQRQIENYPSASEVAQYYQRFIELYDAINQEMEEYKKSFTIFNNLQDAKSMATQFADIMRTFKENYQGNLKDKKGKEELNKNLATTYNGLKDGLTRCQMINKQQKDKRDKAQEQYIQQVQLEREYYRLLKEIKLEYEKNEQFILALQN